MWVKWQCSVGAELRIAAWGEGIFFEYGSKNCYIKTSNLVEIVFSVFTHFKGFYFTSLLQTLLGFNVSCLQINTNA